MEAAEGRWAVSDPCRCPRSHVPFRCWSVGLGAQEEPSHSACIASTLLRSPPNRPCGVCPSGVTQQPPKGAVVRFSTPSRFGSQGSCFPVYSGRLPVQARTVSRRLALSRTLSGRREADPQVRRRAYRGRDSERLIRVANCGRCIPITCAPTQVVHEHVVRFAYVQSMYSMMPYEPTVCRTLRMRIRHAL